jgi:flagellin
MALTILNNIAAIAAENQLNITSNNLNSTLEQLSSGSRINSGADDPAGLAIANGLAANIAALTQSASNATDGVGELQVADGALSQVTTLLDRAVTLATESATGTVSNSQRGAIDTEYQSIKAEIASIGATTDFNGGQVFTNNTLNIFLSDGSTSGSSTIGVSTGLLSPTQLGIGGTPATATLAEAVATPAANASDVLTGGTFVGSTQANGLLTASTQFNALTNAQATFTAGTINLATEATQALTGATTWAGSTKGSNEVTFGGSGVISAGDTIAVGGTTYTFVADAGDLTADNEVVAGVANSTSLTNLNDAINQTAGSAGTNYSVGTVVNANVTSSGTGPITFTNKVNGTAGPTVTYDNVSSSGATAAVDTTAGLVGTEITVGGQNYTFVDSLSTNTGGTANEVLYTGTVATDLGSLEEAVNNGPSGTGSGTNYSTGTVANTNVTAGAPADGAITFTANTNGLAGSVGGTITQDTGGGTGGSFATQVNGTAGSTVTLGSQTYTFVTQLGTGAGATTNEIVGGTLTQELTNLADAINYTSPNTGKYSSGNSAANTAASATVNGDDLGATFTATTTGTAGNSVAVSGTAGTFTNAQNQATSDLAGGTAASTVTIGNQTYTFVNSSQLGTAAPYSVLINTTASGTAAQILGSLTNLADAVNASGTAGVNYSSAAANTFATAGTATAGTGNTSTLAFTAQVNGLGTEGAGTGNYTISTTTGTSNGFAGGTFANGTTGDSVTVGGQTYNFVTNLSTNPGGTPNEVVAGASVAQDLLNLQAAVNGAAGSGTTYSTGTAANNSASVTGTTATTATFTALSSGTGGNSISTAISGGIGSFATTDFTGGSSLQSVGGPAVAGDTATVGGTTYTFVSAITADSAANSVLVGAGTGATSEAASLTNLAAAVNGATGEGVTYGLGTTANASATANATSTTAGGPVNEIVFTALTGGVSGNSIASTSTGGDNIFSGPLFTGGGTSTNDLLTSADATAALTLINNAVATVASLRGNIGATVNRLQAASNVITNQTQNLTSAENDVTAADIPTVVANLSQYSILEQTGVSALAQANQQQQLVLKLLQ